MNDLGISVFTYRRPVHTKRVLEHLRANHPEKLYIFQDGLRDEKDRDDWQRVSDLIRGVDFAETEVFISEENKGLANSIIGGMDYVFSRHSKAIALEDDICVSSQYLSFMNACFERYENNPEVSCVAGGGWPLDIPPDYGFDAFFSYRMSSIAWGTWKDRWQQYSRDYTLLARILRDPEKRRIYDQCGSDIYNIMHTQVDGKCDSWALFWTLQQINHKQVCVLPVRPLAQDIGHDGDKGTNSVSYTTRFDTELWDGEKPGWNLPERVFVDGGIMEQIARVLNNPAQEYKLNSYYSITQTWIECLQKGASFASYFSRRDISSVYIYGASNIGRLLFEQIKDLVEVKGFLEYKKTAAEFCGRTVFDFTDDCALKNENILVTPVHDWDYIAYSVGKRFGKQNLIPLDKMIKEICENE